MVVFETLIVVISSTITPGQLFAGGGRNPPGAFKAFSGSTGAVSIASYYAPGDALARGSVAWGSLGVLALVGLAGIGAAFALLARRDLAP